MTIDPIQLELMRNLFEAAAGEMGITLQRVAFSANIKERSVNWTKRGPRSTIPSCASWPGPTCPIRKSASRS